VRDAAKNMDRQVQPEEVKFCKRCVISNQRPRIVFDDEGVCSACRYAERKKSSIDWDARYTELKALLDRQERTDIIVPCSGGKDSAYAAHILKHEFGMNPLCTKFGPFMYTDIGRRNWDAFNQAGFDTVEMRPNGLLHRKLARLCLEFVGDPFLPFIWGQLGYPMRMALETGTKLVFYGENGEAEYGGDPAANDKPCWDTGDWERVYHKGAGASRMLQIGVDFGAITKEEALQATSYYWTPLPSQMKDIEFHWLGYYLPWHPQNNFYYACENTGFRPNDERSGGTYSKYASIDDKLDGLHYWMAYIKFGLGRASSDAAHEIRDGDITREEAVALVHRYDHEFPERHLTECLEYLGMERDRLVDIEARFAPGHLWVGNKCKHRVA
jgi:N-acetyl sugar amidotransferase